MRGSARPPTCSGVAHAGREMDKTRGDRGVDERATFRH
jgi:hypothetical protein